MDKHCVAAVILAAGMGSRMHSDVPKQNLIVCGKSILLRTVERFDKCPHVDHLVIVVKKGEELFAKEQLNGAINKPFVIVCGGRNRAESAKIGFETVEKRCDLVAIHDCARCMISADDISKVICEAVKHGAATAATYVTDTVKRTDADGNIVETVPRDSLMAMQTPQVFKTSVYRKALDLWTGDTGLITDDNMLVESTGEIIKCVQVGKHNFKVTTRDDLEYLQYLLRGDCTVEAPKSNFRIGHGYDVHRLTEGRKLIIGGVEIPYERGLDGHSDADVLVHAIMDALLGAAGLGDIGRHFPDTSGEFLGISSIELLRRVRVKLAENGFYTVNIDATLVMQRPKISPYVEEMISNVSRALEIPIGAVNIKATTEEKLGFTGNGEGAAAHAVALISK